MSGICGIVNLDGAPVDIELLRKMVETVAHRGPDGIHYWEHDYVGLAHLALHTTPESLREYQPLISRDGMVCLTADARVDNRKELIQKLRPRGYIREGKSTDADLILATYQAFGESCPEHIVGDFSLVIWDDREKKLFCARDPMGVRQLHYARMGDMFCAATEVGQVLEHPAVPKRLNETAVADYLVSNFYDEQSTLFLDVHRLPPAHRLIIDKFGMRLERYWDIDPEVRTVYRHDEDYAAHFLYIFHQAIADRLRTQTDVVSIAMSGGLDSTSIAATAKRMGDRNGGRPTLGAYSFCYPQLENCDEREYSNQMTRDLGIEIEYIDAEKFWFLRKPVIFRSDLESPYLWDEGAWLYCMKRAGNRQSRVFLTGDGGDNLLQGSPMVYADHVLKGKLGVLPAMAVRARKRGFSIRSLLSGYFQWIILPVLPEKVLRILGRFPENRPLKRLPIPDWINSGFARKVNLAERILRPPKKRNYRSWAQQAIIDTATALGATARKIYRLDNTASHFFLEMRYPYFDRRLVEFVLSIPPEQLYRNGYGKVILRRVMAGILPEAIRLRWDKTIFSGIMDLSLKNKEMTRVKKIFESSLLAELGIIDSKKILHTFENYCDGLTLMPAYALMPPITLELWMRQFFSVF